MLRRTPARAALAVAVSMGALVAACNGCRRGNGPDGGMATSEAGPPRVRIYIVSDLAGALEPCGCQKDMLGGVDHFAALVNKEKEKAPNAAVAAVGPLFYMDETILPARLEQDTWKAEAIANGLRATGLVAFAPGKNDWAPGVPALVKLRDASGASLVAANLGGTSTAGALPFAIREIGGVKVAFVGVTMPKSPKGAPEGLTIEAATEALAQNAKKARAEGARIVIGLAAIDRGEAVRAAEAATELDVLAVGSPFAEGDANDAPKPPRFVGPVLVVQPSNHLTRVAIVDFHLKPNVEGRFADGSGLAHASEVTDLQTQIDDLQRRIANWEKDPNVTKADLDAQRARLVTMRDKLAKASTPPAIPNGNFVRYALADVREALGKEPSAAAAMSAYYKRVNEWNKEKFKDKKAVAPAKSEPYFVGGDTCKTCHTASFDVWSKTPHSHAYVTLSKDSKEFNLDCVACHVTGYEKAGGSTVTDNVSPNLKDVQCEQCHGAGSKHADEPYGNSLVAKPAEEVCTGCHHPPHTDIFEYKVRLQKILGPGHGKPGAAAMNEPPKGWKPPKPRFSN